MNRATKITELPALTLDFLNAKGVLIDNVFASLWKETGMKTLLSRSGFNKRSGTPMYEEIYGLMLWIWLKKDSIGMFAREGLQGVMGKDVFYDTINREDLNWRNFHGQTAAKTIQTFKAPGKKAFVVDDTVAQRFGKKMPGISSHFDHTTGRHMMGQQVLTLGLSCDEGFVPLDSELFVSQTKAIELHEPFKEGRSIVANRYKTAQQHTKPEMVNPWLIALKRRNISRLPAGRCLVWHQGDDTANPRNGIGSGAQNEEKPIEIPDERDCSRQGGDPGIGCSIALQTLCA